MSRARTLAGAIGSDGALNVSDVAGLAAVASSGSASDLGTGTLPIARIADASIPASKFVPSAAGTVAWRALDNTANATVWVKLCKIVGSDNDRLTIMLSGGVGYGASADTASASTRIEVTIGNSANANNLLVRVLNSNTSQLVGACYAVPGANSYTWDLWVMAYNYSRVQAFAYGDVGIINATYYGVSQATKPTGGYDKPVGRDVNSLTAGAILQVVSAVNTTALGINASVSPPGVFYDCYTQATITPAYATSKILILVQQSYFHDATGAQGTGFRIARNGVEITTENGFTSSYTNANRVHGYTAKSFLDSPASTSALTYKIRAMHWTSSGSIYYQYGGSESPSTITLIEVAA